MKNIFKIAASLLAGAMVISLASCSSDELDTNQYSGGEVVLSSYGPNPVARGGTLRFLGANLENVTSVTVPGIDPITDIEVVTKGAHGEIRVQLPSEGEEPGYVILTTKSGSTVKTKTELAYSEPIIFDSFSPSSAMPGDVITIKGDYMNLIKEVIFANGVYVTGDDITNVDRYTLTVVVPSQAVTGKVIIGDADEVSGTELANLIYSESEIAIGSPTVKANTAATAKAGDKITFKGEYLNMIKDLTVGGVTVSDFTLAEDNKSITFTIPAEAADGEYTANTYAGEVFTAGELTMTVPTNLSATPSPVKAGGILTVTGDDLDLVTAVNFVNAEGATFTYDKTAGLSITVPAAAQAGDLTLVMANAKTATVAVTLVEPTITGFDKSTLVAGESFVITGTDLDLVTGVQLGGKDETFEYASGQITVTTSATSVSGVVTLKLANSTDVKSSETMTVTYDAYIIISDMPASQHIGQSVTLKGTNFNMIETMYVGNTKVVDYVERTDSTYTFLVPEMKIGTYKFKFTLFSGDEETYPSDFEVKNALKTETIWADKKFTVGEWNGGNQDLAWGGYDWAKVKAGSILTLYLTPTVADTEWWCVSLRHGDNWGNIPGLPGQYDSMKRIDVELTGSILADLVANGGLVITGAYYSLDKVTISSLVSQEVTIYKGPTTLTWDDTGRFGLAKSYFEGCTAGESKLIFYITQTADWGQIQLNDAGWANVTFSQLGGAYLTTDSIKDKSVTKYELILDEAALTQILASGGTYWGTNTAYQGDGTGCMVLQGSSMIINEITILK